MAKNYNKSDYARNRYASNIVYSGADGVYELAEKEFLASDQTLTHEDFLSVKEWSDDDYLKQDRADTAENKRTVALDDIGDSDALCTESVADEYIRHVDERAKPNLKDAMAVLDACLTETQKKRYLLYHYQGYDSTEIAAMEGVRQNAIWDSLMLAEKKLKKYLSK